MSKHTHVWTWPIAGYLFLGGLGAGMIIVAAIADLFFGLAFLFVPCAAGSFVALGLGSFLLIFELGRPLQFWRVFSKEKAVLTFGAWMVILLILLDLWYFSFWFGFVPWSQVAVLRQIVATLCLLVGSGVMLYTGVELSSMKARVFWNTPALPILFALSGLLCGAAANYLVLRFWPFSVAIAEPLLQQSLGFEGAAAEPYLLIFIALFAALTLVASLIYVYMLYFSASAGAKKAASRWIKGSYAWAFWGGLVVVGLVLPLTLLALSNPLLNVVAAVCLIAGGLALRFLVVYCDDRREFKGEALHKKRLPNGDEPFLKAHWS